MRLLQPIEPININHLGKFMRFTIKDNYELFDIFEEWKFVYSHNMIISMQNNEVVDCGITRQYSTNLSMN